MAVSGRNEHYSAAYITCVTVFKVQYLGFFVWGEDLESDGGRGLGRVPPPPPRIHFEPAKSGSDTF